MNDRNNFLKIDCANVDNADVGFNINKTNTPDSILIQNSVISNCRVGFQIGQPISDSELLISALVQEGVIPHPLQIDDIRDLIASVVSANSISNAQVIIDNSYLKDKVENYTVWVGFATALLELAKPFIN